MKNSTPLVLSLLSLLAMGSVGQGCVIRARARPVVVQPVRVAPVVVAQPATVVVR
jgi:hypothetical protein